MSTASAKPAPLKLSEFLRVAVSELRSIANGFASDAMKPEYSAAASESYIGRTKRIFIEARALEIQAESLEASPAALTREEGGRIVREAWLNWLANSPSISGQRPASWSAEWNDLKEEDKEVDRQIFEAVAGALSKAPPATGRTALKAIQEKIEDRLQAILMPKGSSTEDTLRWVLSLFDAQERARAKAASEQGGVTLADDHSGWCECDDCECYGQRECISASHGCCSNDPTEKGRDL